MNRRNLLRLLPAIPIGGSLLTDGGEAAAAVGNGAGVTAKGAKSIYDSIGVRPLINARGTVTIVGATRVLPEVRKAMDAAVREYVQLDELMDGVGQRLAELTGAEWGCVTSGASAALTMATAACITRGDPDKLWQIPDLAGLKDEVIIPSYSRTAYDAAARSVGARMVDVSTREELEAAVGPRTAMIMVLAGSRSENGPLSLSEIAAVAKPHGIPVLADAAAEELEVPNPHLVQGADLVAYSGGKCLRGPQCAGLLLGRKDLIKAAWICSAPHHGFGRGHKVGREEVMGMLTAVEMWMKRDHAGEQKMWISWAEFIAGRLNKIAGVKTEIRPPRGRSNHFPSLRVEWDASVIPLTGQQVEQLLWDGNPRIAVGGAGSFLPFPPNDQPNIRINTSQLEEGEERIIADRVFEVLSKPKPVQEASAAPALDVSGQWDVEMKFAASVADQKFIFEQKGSELLGTHFTDYAPRDLAGTLHGTTILVRSSYTRQGVRLNFTFTGTVNKETMEGEVSMGEYGMAAWKAKRRDYQPPGARRRPSG